MERDEQGFEHSGDAAPRGVALVLGAYGLIGAEIVRALAADGWRVRGLGRSRAARRLAPEAAEWIQADLRDRVAPESWRGDLAGVGLIVNAAGALDDGPRDGQRRVHVDAVSALVGAADGAQIPLFIQISAPGAAADSAIAFLATKGEGDAAVKARRSGGWVVFRPGLVLGARAYGGSALLRAAASFPGAMFVAHAGSLVQTVALAEVAEAVRMAARGEIPSGSDIALVEAQPRPLARLAADMRVWLGLPPARVLSLPGVVGDMLNLLGDAAVALGWRTPMSSTAAKLLAKGVRADPSPAERAMGRPLSTFEESLARTPPPPGALLSARAVLLRPLILGALSLFWLATGAIALAHMEAAASLLVAAGLGETTALAVVAAGSLVDLAIGAALLWRPTSRRAAQCAILVTIAYLAGGTILTPELWADPLGPLVKAIPAAVLALTLLALLEER